MIDIKDLQIGDWVMTPYGLYQVDTIYDNGNASAGLIELASSELNGIPLTPEILEKNGFEKQSDYQWKYRDKGCKIVISIAPQIEIEGEILGEPPVNIVLVGALFDINITSNCYVHTLQHFIRICQIEKTIEL